jgi:hypothetical protein
MDFGLRLPDRLLSLERDIPAIVESSLRACYKPRAPCQVHRCVDLVLPTLIHQSKFAANIGNYCGSQ